jgi:hypothetical protein
VKKTEKRPKFSLIYPISELRVIDEHGAEDECLSFWGVSSRLPFRSPGVADARSWVYAAAANCRGVAMNVRWVVLTTLGLLLLGLPLMVGCGGGGTDSGPAEEPNVGPGGPPGAAPGITTKPAKSAKGK